MKRRRSVTTNLWGLFSLLICFIYFFPVTFHNLMARAVYLLGAPPESIPYWYGTPGVVGEAVYNGNALIVKEGRHGWEPVWLQNNSQAIDPSWPALLRFLEADDTDTMDYTTNTLVHYEGQVLGSPEFVCGNVAEQLHNRAEAKGIRCAHVSVDLEEGRSIKDHACNAFQTTDRGLVFIDCTGNRAGESGPSRHVRIVEIEVGAGYSPRYLFDSSGWTCVEMGIVRRFSVHW